MSSLDENASSTVTENTNLLWAPQLDTMLANWCDQAKCFEWMHNESFCKYNAASQRFIILVTILTSISGVINIMAGNEDMNGFHASSIFGAFTVLTSLGHVLQDKLGYTQSAQIHRIYCGTWGQIRRKIEIELVMPYESRKQVSAFLKMIRTEIDHVSTAGASLIPKHIREQCYLKFGRVPGFDVPDICGQLEHTQMYSANPPEVSSLSVNVSVQGKLGLSTIHNSSDNVGGHCTQNVHYRDEVEADYTVIDSKAVPAWGQVKALVKATQLGLTPKEACQLGSAGPLCNARRRVLASDTDHHPTMILQVGGNQESKPTDLYIDGSLVRPHQRVLIKDGFTDAPASFIQLGFSVDPSRENSFYIGYHHRTDAAQTILHFTVDPNAETITKSIDKVTVSLERSLYLPDVKVGDQVIRITAREPFNMNDIKRELDLSNAPFTTSVVYRDPAHESEDGEELLWCEAFDGSYSLNYNTLDIFATSDIRVKMTEYDKYIFDTILVTDMDVISQSETIQSMVSEFLLETKEQWEKAQEDARAARALSDFNITATAEALSDLRSEDPEVESSARQRLDSMLGSTFPMQDLEDLYRQSYAAPSDDSSIVAESSVDYKVASALFDRLTLALDFEGVGGMLKAKCMLRDTLQIANDLQSRSEAMEYWLKLHVYPCDLLRSEMGSNAAAWTWSPLDPMLGNGIYTWHQDKLTSSTTGGEDRYHSYLRYASDDELVWTQTINRADSDSVATSPVSRGSYTIIIDGLINRKSSWVIDQLGPLDREPQPKWDLNCERRWVLFASRGGGDMIGPRDSTAQGVSTFRENSGRYMSCSKYMFLQENSVEYEKSMKIRLRNAVAVSPELQMDNAGFQVKFSQTQDAAPSLLVDSTQVQVANSDFSITGHSGRVLTVDRTASDTAALRFEQGFTTGDCVVSRTFYTCSRKDLTLSDGQLDMGDSFQWTGVILLHGTVTQNTCATWEKIDPQQTDKKQRRDEYREVQFWNTTKVRQVPSLDEETTTKLEPSPFLIIFQDPNNPDFRVTLSYGSSVTFRWVPGCDEWICH